MAEYTPTTEQVRRAYRSGSNIHRETLAQHYMGAPLTDYGAEFDRWLAAHEAQVRAEALREAADNMPISRIGQPYEHAAEWLRRRGRLIEVAARIARDGGGEG